MRGAGYRWRGKAARRGASRALALSAALLSSAGCASDSYMGIALAPGAAPLEVQQLARRAQGGDKQAQLALGIRYEEGNGVGLDRRRAMKLYRQAARDSGGTLWVYAPSPGNGAPGRVIPVNMEPRQAGLAAAQMRAQRLWAIQSPCLVTDQRQDGSAVRPDWRKSVPNSNRRDPALEGKE